MMDSNAMYTPPGQDAARTALMRMQRVLLDDGYEYVFGDEATWPDSAVMMSKGSLGVVVSPFGSGNLTLSDEMMRNPQLGLLLAGHSGPGDPFVQAFLSRHRGNVAYLDVSTGQWILQGKRFEPFGERMLDRFADPARDEALATKFDCRRLLAQTREAGEFYAKTKPQGKPWASTVLVGLCVLVFFLLQHGNTAGAFSRMFGDNRADVLAGQWWRLLTCSFLHASLMHLWFNMMAMWYFGRQVEVLQGVGRMLACYFYAVLVGSLASLVVHTNLFMGVGASGGLFGLMGVMAAMLIRHHKEFPPMVRQKLRSWLFSILVFNVVFSFMPQIDLAAHVGGLLGGLAMGLVLTYAPLKSRPVSLAEKVLAIALTGLLVLGGAAILSILR